MVFRVDGVEVVKKRDGNIVEFKQSKIRSAMEKSMLAVWDHSDKAMLDELTEMVLSKVAIIYGEERIPDVESIQDMVERSLMEKGLYDVAKSYILYRERHNDLREEKRSQVLAKIKKQALQVTKRNGKREPFDGEKFKRFLSFATSGYEGVVDIGEFITQCEAGLYDGISTSEIAKLFVMTGRSFIERDPTVFSSITAKLFLSTFYKEIMPSLAYGNFDQSYRNAFVEGIKIGVESGKFSKEMLSFNLEALSKNLDIGRDHLINYMGLQTLYDRYFVSEPNLNRHIETPQGFWMRVAMGLAINEKDKEKRAIEFYNILSTLRFVASTPTLFHSGTTHPQLSSCYLTTVGDSLENIFKSISDNAQLSKWSGGLGNDWTSVRATGSLIKSTGVNSQGVIPFLKIANDTTLAINRSGKRRGATCAYLETWHLDIEDFLDLRRNTGDERRRTQDMDTANWIPDLFIKRVIEDGQWTLFSPEEVPDLHELYGEAFEERYEKYERDAEEGKLKLSKKVRATDLWKRMLTSLYETGHPWIVFKDPSNIRSPQDHVGVVHSSNLCTEITLNTSKEETAVCNLGSVNLGKHIVGGKLDEELLKNTIGTAMRMLDNVIDINFYPTIEARNSNMKHRPVGLGIMGFQDALFMLDINFDSEEAVRFADESMESIAYHSILASSELAKERGAYETFKGSKWDRGILPADTIKLLEKERKVPIEISANGKKDWSKVRESIRKHGMRNSNCMAIAPTATISNISGCFPSIEPMYNNLYVKSNMSGEFTIVNMYLVEDLKSEGMWNPTVMEDIKRHDGSLQQITYIPKKIRDKYKSAFEIDPEWLIKAAAYRGKWIDQSQSLNIFTATTSGKKLSELYAYAWRTGLKTTYYLRTMGASSIEKSTVDINKMKSKTGDTIAISMVTESGKARAMAAIEKAQAVVDVQDVITEAVKATSPACPVGMTEEERENCEACQ